jgi:hypothetical protein
MTKHDVSDGERVQRYPRRPVASRDSLGRAFLQAMEVDFGEHGKGTIRALREERPHDYLKLVATLVPKEFSANDPGLKDMTDDELASVLSALRSAIAAKESERGRDGSGPAPDSGAP